MDAYRSSKLGFAVELALMVILGCRDRVPELSAEPALENPTQKILYVDSKAIQRERLALVPEKRQGKVIAVRVFLLAGDAGAGPSERLGFKTGDQIEAVDGILPSAPNDAFGEALRRIGKSPETQVRVRRNGRSIVLIYRPLTAAR